MVTEVQVQGVVEGFQQILECGGACLILGCPDPSLRHPLLDFLPGSSSAAFSSEVSAGACLRDLLLDERVRALCDLAVQSGRMQALHGCASFVDRWRIQSIAAVPLERPLGALGVLLLVDEQPERFGASEERLLYACLSMYVERLEVALRERSRAFAQDCCTRIGRSDERGAWPYTAPDQLIKSEFVSMVGHELRAPLSIIKGYTGLLQAYGGDSQRDQELVPDRQQHYLDVIMEQTNLLDSLLNDLLDIARIQHGKMTLRSGYVDVGKLCRQVIQLGQLRADQQEPGKYQLECRVAAQLPPAWADANRLQQVLLNVVENAIKYSPEGGRIELEASLSGNQVLTSGRQRGFAQVCITIRDQGVGISAQHIARLFQPFERLEQPANVHIRGSGLGLYIARMLVEAMGGSISLQSCEGSGTNVTIILPMVGPDEVIALETVAQLSSLPVG